MEQPIRISYQEALMYAALLNAAIGFLFGLIPLIFGIIKGRLKYGILGIISATLGGAILGIILSIPAAAVFTWLIVRSLRSSGDFAPDSKIADAQALDSEDN
ncbi:MAG: hypothetical protein H7070_15660 [Saprospiraceae bacterium]|nr:hypothetical protein [Pyrinomonadaceae bacterium]